MTRDLINEARKIMQGETLTEAVSKFEIQFDEVSFFKGNDLMKAMYGESRENAKRYLDTKPGSLEEAVLKSRGLVK